MDCQQFGCRQRHRLMVGVGVFAAVCIALAGCGESGPKLNPVKGKVLFKGQPAGGAQIVFHPASAGSAANGGSAEPETPQPKPYGAVGADGSFSLRTEPFGEGAPAGDYNVTASWIIRDANDPLKSTSKLPTKYADPTASGLKATVKDGPNELQPFNLSP